MGVSPKAVITLISISAVCLIFSLIFMIVAFQAFSRISNIYYELQSGHLVLSKVSTYELEVVHGEEGGAISIIPNKIIMYMDHNQQTILRPGEIQLISSEGHSYVTLSSRGDLPIINFMNSEEDMQAGIVLNEDNLRFLFTHNQSPGGWEIEADLTDLVNP